MATVARTTPPPAVAAATGMRQRRAAGRRATTTAISPTSANAEIAGLEPVMLLNGSTASTFDPFGGISTRAMNTYGKCGRIMIRLGVKYALAVVLMFRL